MPGVVYALDADVFITAWRQYYAPAFAPMFWETLIGSARDGHLLSIDRVRDELKRGNDDLWQWASGSFAPWFVSTDDSAIFGRYREIVTWVQLQNRFKDAAKAEFCDAADGWLVAYALNGGCTVVTQEAPNPDSKVRVKIPDVCAALNVPCVNTFQMLRKLGVRWG